MEFRVMKAIDRKDFASPQSRVLGRHVEKSHPIPGFSNENCWCSEDFWSVYIKDLDLHTVGRYFVRNQMLGASRFRRGFAALLFFIKKEM